MLNSNQQVEALTELLARISMRDQKALHELYQTVAPKLNGIAMKMLNDADLSNDALQETMLQIWNNAGKYCSDLSEPMTWMTSLLRYRTLDKLRSEKREQNRRDEFGQEARLLRDAQFDMPLEAVMQHDTSGRLATCLNALEALNRKAILMAYYYGYSREDISMHLDQSINTVKSWLKRSLTRLASCLGH